MEKNILQLFLTKNRIKFNEIEKSLKIRSNKLDYHLKKLIEKKIIEKNNNHYRLTESSEYLIPYISEKNSVLPVVLIHIGDKKKAFMYKREKRPYKNMLSLPGGRILIGEKISDAVKRIIKEKHNLIASFEKINSILIENIIKNKKIIQTFFLIFVSAKTKGKIEFTDLKKNKTKIISSDFALIKKDSGKKAQINTINSRINEF